jgi:hypothetical protein
VQDSLLSHLFAAPNAVMVGTEGEKYGNAYIPSPWSSALSTD